MNSYWLALGSNIGDRAEYLRQARTALQLRGNIKQASNVIETEPFGVADKPFLNQVIHYQSHLPAAALLDQLKNIEQELGRQVRPRWDNREIDLDIILWDGPKLDTVTPTGRALQIPHPELHNRQFLLNLLNELHTDTQ